MNLLQDIRYGVRMLMSKPGVTAAAVLSLALGVGANSAVFSLIDALMLKGLPGVEAPEELVVLGPGTSRGISVSTDPVVNLFSYPRYRQLRDGADVLSSLTAISSIDANAYIRRADEESPLAASARMVGGDYFSTLGVRPERGRLLGPDDDRTAGGHPVAVLDYGYWQEVFGGDEAAVGSSIVLNDRSFTIVGVAAREFAGDRLGSRPDLYVPLHMQAEAMRNDLFLERSELSFLHLLGRLAPGVSREQAEQALAARWQTILREEGGESPSEEWLRGMERAALTLTPGSNGYASLERIRQPLWLLFGVTGLVLLIACANVANLLLARAAARTREIAVRAALGAGRRRLFRQMLVESLLLASIAGAAAFLCAGWSREALVAMSGTTLSELGLEPGFDWRVLGATMAVALATGLLFGTVPAWRAGRTNVVSAMRGGRGSVGGAGRRLRTALVVAQTALSLVLLFAAGLFVQSLGALAKADLGFQRDSLLSVRLDPRGGGLQEDKQPELGRRLLEAVEALPGVRSAALSQQAVLSYGNYSTSLNIRGYEPGPDEDMDARMFYVSPGFFETVGAPLLAGRAFGPEDREGATPVMIVDQALVDRFFPDADPLAQVIEYDRDIGPVPVVGVLAAAKMNHAREEVQPTAYISGYANPIFWGAITIRADGDPSALAASVRQAVAAVEPRLPISEIVTVEQRMQDQARADKMLLDLVSGFGVLALLLAAVGLYGVLSYRVAGRTSEIGLRMAVGADQRDVLGLVLREGLLLAGGGVLLGAAAAPFAAAAIESLLYQPDAWNLAPLAMAAAVLLAASVAAALAPSLRAARLDPVTALREE